MELQIIQNRIYEIRGQKVMLDFDLAELYQVETKRLKEAVRRNINRFPPDFMFELTREEHNFLKSQNASLEPLRSQSATLELLRTQIATSKRGGRRYEPFAFIEQGVAMLASILNSPTAIQVNISIVRAFVMLRQYALTYSELAQKITELESKYDGQFSEVNSALTLLLQEKQKQIAWEERQRIGFKKEGLG